MSKEILEQITEASFKGDYKTIGRLVRKARREGYSNENIIGALSAGLIDVSEKYKKEGMYLDDIIKAAGAFEAGYRSLGIQDESKEPEKKVVLGVMGGPWTIGTNIVAANLKAHGFEVIDAGSDISPEEIAKTVKKKDELIAKRFEIYFQKMEIANGYHELTDYKEQKKRYRTHHCSSFY